MPRRKKDTYMVDPNIETMPRDDLKALQLQKLRKIVKHAYENVGHYRKSFDDAGVAADDLKCLGDLARFPFTVKDDLRATYPFDMFAVPRQDIIRIHVSSGTTGKPTVGGYTRADLDVWSDLMARTMASAGTRPGDIIHNAYGYGLFTGGLGAHYGGERLGCTVTPVSGGFSERQIMLIEDFAPRILCATPSYALNLAEAADREGVDLRESSLEIGIFGAEPWTDEMRAELDDRLGIKSVDIYGLSEILGPGVAGECVEARTGLHAWEDCFVFETIYPESGEPLPLGEVGELVITTLAKWAQPMIRYRTRDITRLEDGPCACGRTHARTMRITGRSDDMLIIRGVNVYPSQIEAVLLGRPDIEPHYQLVVARTGNMDTLSVEIEAAPTVRQDEYDRIAKDAEHHIKSRVGVTCRAVVLEAGGVPRSEGKAVRVRDLRKKD